MELSRLYAHRFTGADLERKARVWQVLCDVVFTRWIQPADVVLDLGAGYCEFINAIRARRRIALDANPDVQQFAAQGVEVRIEEAGALRPLFDSELDVIFSSNFLEHLPDKAAITQVIADAFRALRPGGRIILMGPNARLIPGEYWDFYDHHVPLTERSLCELLRVVGFRVELARARFVPYTLLRWRLPTPDWLVRAYLALHPLSGWFFGQQFLVCAVRPRE